MEIAAEPSALASPPTAPLPYLQPLRLLPRGSR